MLGAHPPEEERMKRWASMTVALFAAYALQGCTEFGGGAKARSGWTSLFDGQSLAHFNQVGNTNWQVADGTVSADSNEGYLVSKEQYGDFEAHVEFYAETDTNSGVFLRCTDPVKIGSANCYEVNIWDIRPVQKYGTAAIVDVAEVVPTPKAGGHWNTFDITAQGDHLVVVFNGVKTVDTHDGKRARGFLALQKAAGVDKTGKHVIRFRKVEIRPL